MIPMKDFRILIVDDEVDLLEVLAMRFSASGAQVETATNGLDAFEKFQNQPFDLVLSDVRMAKGDGLALLRKIRLIDAKLPIFFFMTGYSDFTPEEAKAFGANEVLHKPFENRILEGYLRTYFPSKVIS